MGRGGHLHKINLVDWSVRSTSNQLSLLDIFLLFFFSFFFFSNFIFLLV